MVSPAPKIKDNLNYQKAQLAHKESVLTAWKDEFRKWLYREGAFQESDELGAVTDRYNSLLKEVIEKQRYQTAKSSNDQLSVIKALDFADDFAGSDGIRCYNVCRAKNGERTCGLAYPAKLWWQDIEGATTQYSLQWNGPEN